MREPTIRRKARSAKYLLPTGNPDRMGALLEDLQPRMIAVALRYTRDPEVAKDVVQNAYEKVLRHGSKFRGQSLVSTWIHRIGVNEALMWLRSEGRRHTLREDDSGVSMALVDPGAGPEPITDFRLRTARLFKHMNALSGEELDVVVGCALGGPLMRNTAPGRESTPRRSRAAPSERGAVSRRRSIARGLSDTKAPQPRTIHNARTS